MGPTQYDWHAYVKGKFGLRGGHAQREGGVKTKGENLKIQEARREARNKLSLTALTRNQTCPDLDFRVLASSTVRQKHLLFKPPSLWCFVTVASGN